VTQFNFDVWGTNASVDYDDDDTVESQSQGNEEDDDEIGPQVEESGLHVLGIIAPEKLFVEEEVETNLPPQQNHGDGDKAKTKTAFQERKFKNHRAVSRAASKAVVDDDQEWSVVEPEKSSDPQGWGCRVGLSFSELLSSYTGGLCTSTDADAKEISLLDTATTMDSNHDSSIVGEHISHQPSTRVVSTAGMGIAGAILKNQPESIDFSSSDGEPPAIRRFTTDAPSFAEKTDDSILGAIPMTISRSEGSGLSTISEPFVSNEIWRIPSTGRPAFSPLRKDSRLVAPSSVRSQGKPPKPSSPSHRIYREI